MRSLGRLRNRRCFNVNRKNQTMKNPKLKINDSALWKGNVRTAEVTVVGLTDNGYMVYEWDRKITHPATEESLTKLN